MNGLPVPRLTATIMPATSRHALGNVIIHGVDVPSHSSALPKPERERVNAAHHCSRCVEVGLDGVGHNRRSQRCPQRITHV